MRAVQVTQPGGPLQLVERDIPEPGPGLVRIKVQACGVCHSDTVTREGLLPGIQYPRVPGHEVIGVIDAAGPAVPHLAPGDRAGVGWHGGHCGYCNPCRRGDFFACSTDSKVTGVTSDGGYAEYMLAPARAVARVPVELAPEEAAPLMCAGVTTFNCLRHSGAGPGDLVAILGIGGLGHLGVQFASRMGFRTVAIARGKDKEPLARRLGAWRYIDSQTADPAAALREMGGAAVILATVTAPDAMAAAIGGLAPNGVLMIVGAVQSLPVPAMQLLIGRQSVKGWYSGTAVDSEDALKFAVLTGVRSMNEVYPLDRAPEAYERMRSGKARFRAVLTMS